MKHKIGEKTSTSLLSWTHGPRWDYSRSIPEAIMVMEGPQEINPPSGSAGTGTAYETADAMGMAKEGDRPRLLSMVPEARSGTL